MTDAILYIKSDDGMWFSLPCRDMGEIKYSSKVLFPVISEPRSRPQLFSAFFFKLREVLIILTSSSWQFLLG